MADNTERVIDIVAEQLGVDKDRVKPETKFVAFTGSVSGGDADGDVISNFEIYITSELADQIMGQVIGDPVRGLGHQRHLVGQNAGLFAQFAQGGLFGRFIFINPDPNAEPDPSGTGPG